VIECGFVCCEGLIELGRTSDKVVVASGLQVIRLSQKRLRTKKKNING